VLIPHPHPTSVFSPSRFNFSAIRLPACACLSLIRQLTHLSALPHSLTLAPPIHPIPPFSTHSSHSSLVQILTDISLSTDTQPRIGPSSLLLSIVIFAPLAAIPHSLAHPPAHPSARVGGSLIHPPTHLCVLVAWGPFSRLVTLQTDPVLETLYTNHPSNIPPSLTPTHPPTHPHTHPRTYVQVWESFSRHGALLRDVRLPQQSHQSQSREAAYANFAFVEFQSSSEAADWVAGRRPDVIIDGGEVATPCRLEFATKSASSSRGGGGGEGLKREGVDWICAQVLRGLRFGRCCSMILRV
jgi:hypothetical protein